MMSKFSIEEKIKIVLDGMRYPEGITGLCCQVGISRSTYYHWQRTLLEKGKEGLIARRNGKSDPQKAKLIQENQRLKELVANLSVDNLVLKKRLMGG
jgi:transposase